MFETPTQGPAQAHLSCCWKTGLGPWWRLEPPPGPRPTRTPPRRCCPTGVPSQDAPRNAGSDTFELTEHFFVEHFNGTENSPV